MTFKELLITHDPCIGIALILLVLILLLIVKNHKSDEEDSKVTDNEILKKAYIKVNGKFKSNGLGTFMEHSVDYWQGDFAEKVWKEYFKKLNDVSRSVSEK